MAETRNISSTKRFGPRYGRKTKQRFGVIEAEQRKLHKCPYCNCVKVKRVAMGIWKCRKCGAKFAGKAYSVTKKITFDEEAPAEEIQQESPIEEKEE
ncbi:MAG TPA: 50S ribosomal protein L37ae [Candidatus Nanoarchaeia archaeon]|nr:50S ribosomal protein L37ae [Candidatus Nanoarchaeia archaeon]